MDSYEEMWKEFRNYLEHGVMVHTKHSLLEKMKQIEGRHTERLLNFFEGKK